MTTANKITCLRIALIPVFVGCALYYGESVADGDPKDWIRVAAIVAFIVAALSDGVDGYIARHFNQKTKLGELLDPLADKGLLLSAVITLSITRWYWQFPLWFPIAVIFRDFAIVLGAMITNYLTGDFHPKVHWTGKVTTFLQMIAVAWVMLSIPMDPIYIVSIAGVFTLISGVVYAMKAIRHLQRSGHAHPDSQETSRRNRRTAQRR